MLEIHESALAQTDFITWLRGRLMEINVALAYDDFGAGQARLFELAEAPPHYLKFDRRFVTGLDHAPTSRQRLVASLVAAARELLVKTVAEGVETAEEARGVHACGLLARPGLPLRPAGAGREDAARSPGGAAPRRGETRAMVRQELALGSAVADRIIGMLEDGPQDAGRLARGRCRGSRRSAGPDVYAVLLFVLTQLDFPPEKAQEHWLRILRQWEELNRRVPEKVDLRVAVLQYFLRSQRKLHNPAIVEIKILRRTAGLGHLRRAHPALQLPLLPGPRRLRGPAGDPLRRAAHPPDDRRRRLQGLQRHARPPRRQHGPPPARLRAPQVGARGGRGGALRGRGVRDPPARAPPKLAALKLGEKLRQAIEKAGIGKDAQGAGRAAHGEHRGGEPARRRGDRGGARGPGGPRALHREEHGQELREAVLRRAAGARAARRVAAPAASASSRRAPTRSPRSTSARAASSSTPGSRSPAGAFVKVQLALPPCGEPVECAVRVLRVVGARGGFEIGTRDRPHAARAPAPVPLLPEAAQGGRDRRRRPAARRRSRGRSRSRPRSTARSPCCRSPERARRLLQAELAGAQPS